MFDTIVCPNPDPSGALTTTSTVPAVTLSEYAPVDASVVVVASAVPPPAGRTSTFVPVGAGPPAVSVTRPEIVAVAADAGA